MLGAVAGDVIGSRYERRNVRREDFELLGPGCRATDDTVLTVATAQALLDGLGYDEAYRTWARRYPRAGYGGLFVKWMNDPAAGPYDSYGNGSAMRVSPVAHAFDDLDTVLEHAALSAAVTHNHPEGVRGAKAIAGAAYLARRRSSVEEILEFGESAGYAFEATIEELRENLEFDATCQGTVPSAFIAFASGHDFESTVRKAVSIGGDSDTIAAMAGSIAGPFYGVPPALEVAVNRYVPPDMRSVLDRFELRFSS